MNLHKMEKNELTGIDTKINLLKVQVSLLAENCISVAVETGSITVTKAGNVHESAHKATL